MSLSPAEIFPGSIAYFDHSLLAGASFQYSGTLITRSGPMVCYKVSGDSSSSFWTPLTTEYRPERVPIAVGDIHNAYGALARTQNYLQDGRNTCTGDNAIFLAAAQSSDLFCPATRPSIGGASFAQILSAIQTRGGL